MKKHLLGFAIFSFIFAAFAVLFAFLYAPKIPQTGQVEEVKQPVFERDVRNMCNMKSINNINNRFEVISTQIDLDKKQLISQIRMKLDRYGGVPKNLFVSPKLYTERQAEVKEFDVKDVRVETLEIRKDTNEAIFDVVTDLSKSQKIERKENFYVQFEINATYENSLEIKNFRTEAKPVLFIHGESSIIEK